MVSDLGGTFASKFILCRFALGADIWVGPVWGPEGGAAWTPLAIVFGLGAGLGPPEDAAEELDVSFVFAVMLEGVV